jgi:hypothetical protein
MAVNKSQQAGRWPRALRVWMLVCIGCFAGRAFGADCLTQAQMTPVNRNSLVAAAQNIMAAVQAGNVDAVKAYTLPAVAADFGGIANSVQALAPMIQKATITVDALYDLDASTDQAGAQATTFYCGSPVVVLNFTSLPPAHYALAILHATGVRKPQQAAFILARGPDTRWLLAGFFAKPMLEAGHDGLWYWVAARKYAQSSGQWAAWLYYRIAANLLDPMDNLSSPNLTKLMNEQAAVKPANLPSGNQPVTLIANGSLFHLSNVDLTTEFGGLDLDVHYTPDPMQAAQLRNPPDARKQVVDIMRELLAQHPELRSAFHGMWVHADQGNVSLFALELPMDQIAGGTPTASLNPPM